MKLYLVFLLAMNLLSFFTYRRDKLKAQRHQWRIPEFVLLWLGFLGGNLGAIVAMRHFRHKTRHWYFWAVNIAGLILTVLLLAILLKKRMMNT